MIAADGGTRNAAKNTSATTTQGTMYDLRMVADGTNLKVHRSSGGALPTKIFDLTVPMSSGTRFLFYVSANLRQFRLSNSVPVSPGSFVPR